MADSTEVKRVKMPYEWTEFERHILGIDLQRSDEAVMGVLLEIMRKQDEIIRYIKSRGITGE